MAVGSAAAQATTVVHTTFDGATSALSDNGTVSFSPYGCSGGTGSLTNVGPSNGCFAFNGNVPAKAAPGTCTFTSGGAPAPCAGTIASAGTYANIQCGTGTVSGQATVTTTQGPAVPTFDYTIAFSAGQGTLSIGGLNGVTGGGAVSISAVPSPTGCVTVPATGFNVTGDATITF